MTWSDALYGYRVASPREDLSFDRRDSAACVPKGVVTDEKFDWSADRAPRVPWADTVIYETHLRGLTMRLPGIPDAQRGTAAALGHERTVAYLRELGVTAIELLPIHSMIHDRPLVQRGLVNYWGYNTLGYFAPEPRYLTGAVRPRSRAPFARCTPRYRGAAGCRLQPYLRRQRAWPDLKLPGSGPRRLLSAAGRQSALLRQRYRLRQHRELHASTCGAADARLAASLGQSLSRGWLSLRPERDDGS